MVAKFKFFSLSICKLKNWQIPRSWSIACLWTIVSISDRFQISLPSCLVFNSMSRSTRSKNLFSIYRIPTKDFLHNQRWHILDHFLDKFCIAIFHGHDKTQKCKFFINKTHNKRFEYYQDLKQPTNKIGYIHKKHWYAFFHADSRNILTFFHHARI